MARLERYLKKDMKLRFTPGTRYQYSNMGMSLAGHILEWKTGKSYEELLQERIFGLLHMEGSSSGFAKVRGRLVTGILEQGEESPGWAASPPSST